MLSKTVPVPPRDVQKILEHETLERFGWFHEDVPRKVFEPVVEAIELPEARSMHPEEWFEAQST